MVSKDTLKQMVLSGDPAQITEALHIAMEQDAQRLEAEVARRAERVEQFRAEPKPVSRYKIISIAGRRQTTLYITRVSYKDGPGYAVSKIAYGQDKSKAQEFSTAAAEGIQRVSDPLRLHT